MPENITDSLGLLTREQAANYLNVKTQTLAQWASDGKYGIPIVKIGRTVRYRKGDLDKFIEQHLIQSGEACPS